MERLQVVSVDPGDRGSQRCRLGPGLMSALGVSLGSPLLVRVPGGSLLCSAWPRSDLAHGFLQPDLKCVSPGLVSGPGGVSGPRLPPGLSLQPGQLVAMTTSRLKWVRVRAAARSAGFRRLCSPRGVQELVRDMLRGVLVLPGFVVNLEDFDTEIRYVVVEDLSPDGGAAGLITARTTVEVSGLQTAQTFRGRQDQDHTARLGGLQEVSASLRELLQLPLLYPAALRSLGVSCPRGLLLVGPPGVGKTLLVHRVVEEVGASLVVVRGPEVVGPRPGDSEETLRTVFERARREAEDGPCVLFLDELDSLCPRRTEFSAPENRLVAQLLTLMDGIRQSDRFLVVGATNRPDGLDPALRRPGRFDREVVVGVPTAQQRKDILSVLCDRMPLDPEVNLEVLVRQTPGYVGADLSALCREAAMTALRENQASGEAVVRLRHFQEALKVVQPSCLRTSLGRTELAPLHWDQIGGLDQVKLKLKQSIQWPMTHPEAFARLGLTPPRGVLLYGPPGCAKTTLVKAAASSSHCSFLSVSGADLYSPFVGDSENALAQLFRQARACAPCILFLDEIDTLVGSRGEGHAPSGVQTRLLSVLLNEMDGVGLKTLERRGEGRSLQVAGAEEEEEEPHLGQLDLQDVSNMEVMVVAATNRPDCLDAALLRPGRLDQVLYVPPPDQQARRSILGVATATMPLEADVRLEELAALTELFSGADLENLCREAALLALLDGGMEASSVRHSHFLRALGAMSPSLSAQQVLAYQSLT